MFCQSCGKELEACQKFCSNCGKSITSSSTPVSSIPTFSSYVETMGKRRTTNFSKKTQVDKSSSDETTIFASMMKRNEDGNLKQEKGSRLPVKVQTSWGPYDLHTAVFEKFNRYNRYCSEKLKEDFKLIYKNGETIKYIPGTNIPFTVKAYKDDLGVGYSAVVVYLLEYESYEDEETDSLPKVLRGYVWWILLSLQK